eukprot:928975-Pelagomonas_calceolata.AAC.4
MRAIKGTSTLTQSTFRPCSMGKQAYLRKGIGIPSNPGEAPALNFLKWDPTIPSKTAVLGVFKQSGGIKL